ncbi:bifunctional molybdenum cofactor biosynthesis protein MoaC/MoaB [Chryseoglobus sp. 28M-23]|uniref:bifunctional molybdenum cofactor biosynthesis protein MoaC/MoaB n=1 Tax=Chryseoglobus sp. 28M-23 TaxID=2772253 RepID=UPI001CD0A2A9
MTDSTEGRGLSHLDSDGRARMVDVGGKDVTARRAVAAARYVTRPDVIALLRDDGLPKADVLTTARLAGIGAAKRTSELIPLCHPLPLDAVSIDLDLTDDAVLITATASTSSRTGVEMEALTAATVAGLTLHDMIKAVDPEGALTDVRLLEKTGGKRGDWRRQGGAGEARAESAAREPHAQGSTGRGGPPRGTVRPGTAIVLVASTRAAAGTRADDTGPTIAHWLADRGLTIDEPVVVPDAEIGPALASALADSPALIIITGGTGVSPSDLTPEAVRAVLDTELPGIAEAVRERGRAATPTAVLSRAVAGIARGTVVVALPGSPGAVRDGLAVLEGSLEHLLAQIAGGGGHE